MRLTPQPGEALDSWLEALAARANTTWGDMAAAVGLGSQDLPGTGIARRDWLVVLTPTQQKTLGLATGVDTPLIQATTLERFRGPSLTGSGAQATTTPLRWLHSYVSRYCPGCLAETGGRWQSWWRLKWAFACPEHLCLLSDACPACHRVQRHRALPADLIPTPGRCARKGPAARGRNLDRCATGLSDAPVLRLAADHLAVHAQQIMLDATLTDTVSYGIYAEEPVPVEAFLNDVRAVGRRVLVYADTENLHRYVPDDLVALVRGCVTSVRATPPQRDRPRTGWASAPLAAATATAALTVLGAASITDAGERLRDLVAHCRDRGLSVSASNIGWGRGVSRTLIGVQLHALAVFLGPADQLRHRLSAGRPARPDSSRGHSVVRLIPALFWPRLAMHFVCPHIGELPLRSALSAAVSIVGTRLSLARAAYRLGSVTTGAATSRILQILHADPHWTAILAALTHIAVYLQENSGPINYAHRRALDFSDLLVDAEWTQICRTTGTPQGRGVKLRVARCWLYERLSGSPATGCLSALNTTDFRGKLLDFSRHLTPGLLCQLDAAARGFLDRHQLGGEPVTWCPPTAIIENLDLPGKGLTNVNISELRRLIREEHLGIYQAAQRLNTAPSAIRYVLESSPLSLCLNSAESRARGAVSAQARAILTKDKFIDLYQVQRRSLRDIAQLIGASRQTVSRLACEHEIPLRSACRPRRAISAD